MAEATETRRAVNGTTLNVREQGRGDTALVFLHYFGGSGRTWRPVMDLLAPDARCLAPDLRGWGGADAPPVGYAVDDMADDVAALIAGYGLGRFILVGHSLGGKVALALAARSPAGLAALVLTAPSPPTPEPMTEEAREQLRASYGSENATRATLREIAVRPLTAEDAEQAVADNLRASREAWTAWLDAGSREDISARMAAVRVPTRVLAGSEDKAVPQAVTRCEVIGRIAGARLTVLPNAGHLLPLEAPPEVADFVRQAAKI